MVQIYKGAIDQYEELFLIIIVDYKSILLLLVGMQTKPMAAR